MSDNGNGKKPAPDLGVSERALQMARILDRLPPGVYMVEFGKPEIEAAIWTYEVVRLENISKGSFVKKVT